LVGSERPGKLQGPQNPGSKVVPQYSPLKFGKRGTKIGLTIFRYP